jgi:hypothetical protein
MKHFFFLAMLFLTFTAGVDAQSGSTFERYFVQAQAFDRAYPREKVHLHLDNASYYQGDTIWFKAYVVTADSLRPSTLSKPLYVDFVDQLGNVMNRQIVKLTRGEGCGQISLANTFFTGYYEIRAYTKWMLAFGDDASYYTRVVPVYRKRLTDNEAVRSIAKYRMDKSMKQRPTDKLKALNVRFFPEGGSLVQGLTSTVGFEALSSDSGWVDVTGYLASPDGARLATIAALHDGMGTFQYTPGQKPAKAVFDFCGKNYSFDLPEAQPAGYTLTANVREEAIEVKIARSTPALTDSLAVFLFSQGTPLHFVPVDFGNANVRSLRILTKDLPGGTIRVALVNSRGQTLSDRLCFVYPADELTLAGSTDQELYRPFSKAVCRVKVTDRTNAPVANARVSVAVRDGIASDYLRDDHTILTDLLLTSDLKGYVNRPGFYFEDRKVGRRKLLDNLLLIRGWRRYDLQQMLGLKPFTPKYLPESQLMLSGQVMSWYGKVQKDISVTILAEDSTNMVSGTTRTDSLGCFSVPLEDFNGKMQALIQTRRDGKQFNRNANVSLVRNFEPALRTLDFNELSPRWDEPVDTMALNTQMDALDSMQLDPHARQIGEVVVKGKKTRHSSLRDTEAFEREIVGYYNIRQYIDRERDKGKMVPPDVAYMLHQMNPLIDRYGTRYGVDSLLYSANGHDLTIDHLQGCADMMETALLFMDRTGLYAYNFNKDMRVEKEDMTNQYSHMKNDTLSQALTTGAYMRCAFTMADRWDPNRAYRPMHGIRKTEIQGYSKPVEFYSPQYPDQETMEATSDNRRTLYWNPNLTTDANGEITIDCYNSRNATFLDVNAETLVDGKPAAVQFVSYHKKKE